MGQRNPEPGWYFNPRNNGTWIKHDKASFNWCRISLAHPQYHQTTILVSHFSASFWGSTKTDTCNIQHVFPGKSAACPEITSHERYTPAFPIHEIVSLVEKAFLSMG